MVYKNKTILPLVFLAMAILFVWQVWPMMDNISIDKENLGVLAAENAKLNDILVKINSINALSQKNSENIAKFDFILPDKDDKPNLTAAFEALASANGLVIEKIGFSEPASKPEVAARLESEEGNGKKTKETSRTKIVELSLNGSYDSFKSFIGAAENSLRVTDIFSVNFTPSSSGSEASRRLASYIFNLKLKTYLAKPLNENDLLSEISRSDIADLSFLKGKKFSDLVSSPAYSVKIDKAADFGNKNIFAP